MHTADEEIYNLSKASLRSNDGRSYQEFKRSLRPRYFVVWRDIAVAYLALILIGGSLVAVQTYSAMGIFCVPLAGILFGYSLAYLTLFFHEAAHTNLAPSQKWNDRLANCFVGIFFGQHIAAYRIVHFGHHRHHGTPLDTEHSYFDPLNMRFVLGALCGLKALKVAGNRESLVSSFDQKVSRSSRTSLVLGFLLNATIVLTSLFAGYWTLSLAWIIGMLSVFPFLNALRQLLEHRSEFADDTLNYRLHPHGRTNRLFGDSLFARSFGGAGFNRHLLHHWEPQVSYTRLKELEDFLLDSQCAPLFRQRQSTYWNVLLNFSKRKVASGNPQDLEEQAT